MEIEITIEELAELVIMIIFLIGVGTSILFVGNSTNTKVFFKTTELSYVTSINNNYLINLNRIDNLDFIVKNNYLYPIYKDKTYQGIKRPIISTNKNINKVINRKNYYLIVS